MLTSFLTHADGFHSSSLVGYLVNVCGIVVVVVIGIGVVIVVIVGVGVDVVIVIIVG